jgi:hypothetical protein
MARAPGPRVVSREGRGVIRTLSVYPGRVMPEIWFLPGSPAEAIALAYIAARQFPVAAQGAGQSGATAAHVRSPVNCAGAVTAVPATFLSGEGVA